jgi:hypothetical protein
LIRCKEKREGKTKMMMIAFLTTALVAAYIIGYRSIE